MAHRSEVELSEAIQGCAKTCLGHRDPRQCVRSYTEQLVEIQGWSKEDAEEVAQATLDVLATITGNPSLDAAPRKPR